MRKHFLGFTVFLFSTFAFGQVEVASSMVQKLERSPVAPNTASLGTYFDVPVTMSTGNHTFTIPIFTIKSGQLTLPITLSYHGGGIKVNEPASWVGLGWSLNCGGNITKQVNGLDDFYAPSTANTTYRSATYTLDGDFGFESIEEIMDNTIGGSFPIEHSNDLYRILGRITKNEYDGEADEFHYTTPDGSGTIFWDQQVNDFKFNKVNGWRQWYDFSGDNWHLTSSNGTGYSFQGKEKTLYGGNAIPIAPPAPNEVYTSAWYLTHMTDPVTGKSIDFDYDTRDYSSMNQGQIMTEDYRMTTPIALTYLSSETIIRYGTDLTVSSITFDEGTVQFIKDGVDRLDLNGPRALKEIRILDKNNKIKKKFVFLYYYESSRLFLGTLTEINYETPGVNDAKPYVFSYDNTTMAPRFSYAQDIYGYYNGKVSNTTLIPTQVGVNFGSYANRQVDPAYTQAGVLRQIIYPTGGTTRFDYENNRDETNTLYGGLRLKRVINKDYVANNENITEYNYLDPAIQYRPTFHYYLWKASGQGDPDMTCRVFGEPIYPFFSGQGSPITYGAVEKIQVGPSFNLKSKYYFHNSLVSGEGYRNTSFGVPQNKYSNIQEFSNIEYLREDFKYDGSTYQKIKSEQNDHLTLNNFQDFIWNVQAAWSHSMGGFLQTPGVDPYATNPMSAIPSINAYKLYRESLVNNVSESKTFTSPTTYLTERTERVFDNQNGNLKVESSTQSNGDVVKKYYSYVADYATTTAINPENQAINTLRYYNIMNRPVEIITTIKKSGESFESVISGSLFTYEGNSLKKSLKLINLPVLLSSFVFSHNDNNGFYFDSRYELENEIIAYDNSANPEEIQTKSKFQSVIWEDELQIASVQNAHITDVAYCSFEGNVKGKWNFSGTISHNADAPTGSKVYDLSTGQVNRTALDNSKTYVVSYWAKGGSSNVNGINVNPSRTVGNWQYFEHKGIVPSGGSIQITGTGFIDELRLYPMNSVMTSYTYNPLVGMSSQCDANNRISYYHYDGLGRLTLVRDQDKNIVKRICYNYAGQPEACPVPCLNSEPNWQNVGSPYCQVANHAYTGYQLQDQQDVNSCSPTYLQPQTISVYNPTACPIPPPTCNISNCTGNDKKCVNGVCETGIWSVIATAKISKNEYTCTYAYCFSDGSMSSFTQTVSTSGFCLVTNCQTND